VTGYNCDLKLKHHWLDYFGESRKEICNGYKATLIINDNVYLAQQIAADGVHLGLTDMGIPEARRILGTYKIIGATANTFEDILCTKYSELHWPWSVSVYHH
jgi:thiamine-phosphate pyrophosphorylase